MQWGTKECDEYNRKLSKEVYDEKMKEYTKLKKWIESYDSNLKNK